MYEITFKFAGKTYYGLHHFIDEFNLQEFNKKFQMVKNGEPGDNAEFILDFLKHLSDLEQGRDRPDYDWALEEEINAMLKDMED